MSGASSVSQRPAAASFDSAPLVRHLASLDGIRSAPSAHTAAERLGQWLAWTDAIALSNALSNAQSNALGSEAAPRPPAARPPAPSRAAETAVEHARRMRADLARLASTEPSFAATPVDDSQCRASYRLHQRTMAARIEPVRAGLRTALAARSAEHAELAALDAVLERALAPRERQVLATVPTLLDRHHAQQRAAHPAAPADDGAAWQQALLAELDARWEPVEGLIAALGFAPADRA